MTTAELKAAVTPESVKYVSHELDTGDSRSCGTLKATFDTNKGPLVFETVFGSSGCPDEWSTTLNGETVDTECGYPDFGTPHYYNGYKAAERFEEHFPAEAAATVVEWLNEKETTETLTEFLNRATRSDFRS